MQLHPADSGRAAKYAVESLAAGFIGLDFADEVGDLRKTNRTDLPTTQTDYWDFAHRMAIGDWVLIIVHHFTFALVQVSGEYNFISTPDPKLGVWFRHFRRIEQATTSYYADRFTNARQWEQYRMTDTISVLNDTDGKSFKLIQDWARELASQ